MASGSRDLDFCNSTLCDGFPKNLSNHLLCQRCGKSYHLTCALKLNLVDKSLSRLICCPTPIALCLPESIDPTGIVQQLKQFINQEIQSVKIEVEDLKRLISDFHADVKDVKSKLEARYVDSVGYRHADVQSICTNCESLFLDARQQAGADAQIIEHSDGATDPESSKKISDSSSIVHSILDTPDGILVKIILHFNARERLALADSCMKFNTLIFEDKELLRNLDFSRRGRLTTVMDIKRYFSNENICKHVFRVNVQNVKCLKSGYMLNNLFHRAVNLVDVNVHGVRFRDIRQLGNFLESLVHLKRLSVDWPESKKNKIGICHEVLREPFGRLAYLSVEVFLYSKMFLPTLQLCQELEELRITTKPPLDVYGYLDVLPNPGPTKLKNLKVLQVRGHETSTQLKDLLVAMLPDRHQWTDFQLLHMFLDEGFYFEKNVQVCEELRKTKLMESIPYQHDTSRLNCGSFLVPECLLTEVIRITHEDTPGDLCCLTPTPEHGDVYEVKQPCLLKLDEAKLLLKNPNHQISFLHFKHGIEWDCDVHRVASAFPNLTELVLTHIIKRQVSTRRTKKHLQKSLRKKGSVALGEQDSSFGMLVKNTPHVKDLTIYSDICCDKWDLDSLYLIPLWKNLTTLYLAKIPVKDGRFLIGIGRECPKLEKIVLQNIGYVVPCCYEDDLLQMLSYCKNLKEFTIIQDHMTKTVEIFTLLCNNLKLRSVRIMTDSNKYSTVHMIPAIEQLLHSCSDLTRFVCILQWTSRRKIRKLTAALQRISSELNRPHFQYQTTHPCDSKDNANLPPFFNSESESEFGSDSEEPYSENNNVDYDAATSFFGFWNLNQLDG